MKLTRQQLNQLISEQISAGRKDDELLKESEVLAKVGVEAGKALIIALMKTRNGRNTLANILTAIPDFFIDNVCNKAEEITKIMDSRLARGTGRAFAMVCRFVNKAGFSPLYAIAYLLRSLDDETAKIVVDSAEDNKNSSSSQQTDSSSDDISMDDSDNDGIPNNVDIDSLEDQKMVAENNMKLTRKQLKEIINSTLNEVEISLSAAEVEAAKEKLGAEGGAAGPDMVAQAARDAEEGDPDLEDEEILKALMSADASIVQHRDGDVIDKSGLAESKKK